MIYGIIYYLKFMQFYKLLYSKINTKEDFKKAFLYYSWFCSAENLKKMNTGIYVGFHILNLHFNNLLNSTQINITPSKEEDFSHRDYMTVIPFICLACDLVSSYNRKQHQDIGKNLEKDLGDIQLEKVYYRIVRDCFIDGGEGFLSTLELMLLIMIHLRTPEEKRKLVREFLEDIYDDKIGWLNRKLFETIIVIAMMDNNSEKILDSLKIKIEKEGIKNGKDKYSDNHKYNLRNGLLKQIVSGYGIKYAD